MILTLPFPLMLLEIFLFFLFASRIGFFNTLGLYFLPTFIGLLLLSVQSRTGLLKVQQIIAQGGKPGGKILGTAANFMAAPFLVIPSMTTRVVAILLLVPGVRQIFLLVIQAWLTRKIATGAARMSRGGFGMGEGPRVERDATVIDVEPLEIEHSESKTRHDS